MMKQRLGILIMIVLFLTSLISCGNNDEPFSKETKTTHSTAGSSTRNTTQGETTDITDTTDSSSDTSSPLSEATTSKGLTTIKPTTTIPKTEPSPDGKFEIQLRQYHPGLPEYDAEYTFVVKNDGVLVHISGITLKTNDSRVRIKNGKVTVPYSLRKEGKDVVVTATFKSTGQSSKITIPSKKWEQTFNDDFNGNDLDHTKWSVFEPELTYGDSPAYCARDCYEVSNGSLKLLGEKRETVMNGKTYQYTDGAISTENKFNQSLGCFVAAMRYEPWSGICGGFWLLPVFSGQRQSVFFDSARSDLGCGEVDIIEWSKHFGKNYHITEHFWNYNTQAHTRTNHILAAPTTARMDDGKYHAIGVVLTKENSYYYCDGELMGVFDHSYNTTTASGSKKNPVRSFMLFSYRFGADNDSNWVGRWNFKDSDFPLKYEVDWCRAYK